jgi:cephalosporin-C deacetylase-like acetyl esterase
MSEESNSPAGRRLRVTFPSEPGVEIGGRLYLPPAGGRKPAVLLIADKMSSYWIPSTAALAEKMAALGNVVLELEPRDSPGEGERPYVGNWLTNSRANQIGLNLPAMRAHDILRGIDLLSARSDVDPAKIRAMARGVKGLWLLMAAAVDSRIGKVWLDRSPYSLRAALENSMNTNLFDAVIPGFALHWDVDDLIKAMENRAVLRTDPTNWMERPVPLGAPFQYRYVLGDDTDLHDEQDNRYLRQLLQ